MIRNVNTIEEYRSLDKGAILSQAARTVGTGLPDLYAALILTECPLRYGMQSTTVQYTPAHHSWPLSQSSALQT